MAVPKVKLTDISLHLIRCSYNSMYPSQQAQFLATLSKGERKVILSELSFTSDYCISLQVVNLQSAVTLFTHAHTSEKQAVLDSLNESDRMLVCAALKAYHECIIDGHDMLTEPCSCVACEWIRSQPCTNGLQIR